jgi:hypothetical protein
MEPTDNVVDDDISLASIIGYDRSGTTLLGLLLGQISGVCAIGESYRIWKCIAEDWICGCGAGMSRCEFWNEVTRQSFGSITREEAANLEKMRISLCHSPRTTIRIVLRRNEARQSTIDTELCSRLHSMYRAVQRISGSRTIVESTIPSFVIGMTRIGRAVTTAIHVIRDPRAVAFSLTRRRELGSTDGFMNIQRPYRTVTSWIGNETAIARLRGIVGPRYLRVRYEDMVREPVAVLHRIVSLAARRAPELSFVRDARASVRPQHMLAGNPSKFRTGEVEVSADNEWERRMSRRDWMVVTAIAAPFLLLYGYRFGI